LRINRITSTTNWCRALKGGSARRAEDDNHGTTRACHVIQIWSGPECCSRMARKCRCPKVPHVGGLRGLLTRRARRPSVAGVIRPLRHKTASSIISDKTRIVKNLYVRCRRSPTPPSGNSSSIRGRRASARKQSSQTLSPFNGAGCHRGERFRANQPVLQSLVIPFPVVQLINTTPILLTSVKSAIRGIHGTAVQCGCMPVS
jgi:hypothetical protein